MPARRLLVLRHGRTAWNAQRRFQGSADPPLDEVGRMQAYEVGELLAAVRPDLVVSSDAMRAADTARIIATATGLELSIDRRLRERALGNWEGLTREEVAERFPDEFADWVAGHDVARRGGESRDEVAARALDAFADLPEAEVVVLVTHSATGMALCNALLGIAQASHPLGPLANCHWSELVADQHAGGASPDGRARWRLRAHNIGVPGVVAPLPAREPSGADETGDADA